MVRWTVSSKTGRSVMMARCCQGREFATAPLDGRCIMMRVCHWTRARLVAQSVAQLGSGLPEATVENFFMFIAESGIFGAVGLHALSEAVGQAGARTTPGTRALGRMGAGAPRAESAFMNPGSVLQFAPGSRSRQGARSAADRDEEQRKHWIPANRSAPSTTIGMSTARVGTMLGHEPDEDYGGQDAGRNHRYHVRADPREAASGAFVPRELPCGCMATPMTTSAKAIGTAGLCAAVG